MFLFQSFVFNRPLQQIEFNREIFNLDGSNWNGEIFWIEWVWNDDLDGSTGTEDKYRTLSIGTDKFACVDMDLINWIS